MPGWVWMIKCFSRTAGEVIIKWWISDPPYKLSYITKFPHNKAGGEISFFRRVTQVLGQFRFRFGIFQGLDD